MLYALIGIIIGVILGVVLPFDIAPEHSRYTAVIILVILDSIIGAIRAQAKGEYSTGNFITGFLFYGILAAFLVYMGNKLNIDLYLAVIIVLVFRIMQNIGIVRKYYFKDFFKAEKDKLDTKEEKY